MYEQAHNHASYEEPQPHWYHFDAYQHHQYDDHHEQPDIEQPQQQDDIKQPQQQDDEGYAYGVSRVEYEVGPNDYGGGPSDLTLLPRFGGHVACRIWVDADVSIF
jgi:hypothetical protein